MLQVMSLMFHANELSLGLRAMAKLFAGEFDLDVLYHLPASGYKIIVNVK